MYKTEIFEEKMQDLAGLARALAHPARLSILRFLAETKVCISGDISEYIPLSRSTVSQHLKELKKIGLIRGSVDGTKINYCLQKSTIDRMTEEFNRFFNEIQPGSENNC